MSYEQQQNWKDIQQFLPFEYQLTKNNKPNEEWWQWNGHNIHLDTYRNPQAKAKVILFHGVGTNGRQMTTILGRPLAKRGFETIAVDMPVYGVTEVAKGKTVKYEDWVQAGSDLVDKELAKDDRPIFLYGLSAGGMLTYHVAARNKKVKGIVGMTFLDQREQQVPDETCLNLFMSRVGVPMTNLTARTPLAGMKIPMSLAGKMHTLVNDKAAMRVCMKDRTSAGNWTTMSFLSSYMQYVPDIEPEKFDICPVLLTQPAADKWTPLHLSELFLDKINKVPVQKVLLPDAGHYPLEKAGLDVMVNEIEKFYRSILQIH